MSNPEEKTFINFYCTSCSQKKLKEREKSKPLTKEERDQLKVFHLLPVDENFLVLNRKGTYYATQACPENPDNNRRSLSTFISVELVNKLRGAKNLSNPETSN